MKSEAYIDENLWWNGKDYRKSSSAQYDLALSVLRQKKFIGTESVLDLGCGSGQVTAFIAGQLVPQGSVTGLDVSQSMIEEARSAYCDKVKNLSFHVGDAANFQLYQKFDTVVSFSALHWIPDQFSVWKAIKNHLKVGGSTLISLNPLPRDKDLVQAIHHVTSSLKWKSHFVGFKEKPTMPEMTIDEYRDIVLASGLNSETDDCQQCTRYLMYESRLELEKSLKAWLPHVGQVPLDSQNRFINELTNEFIIATSQHGPIYKLEYRHFLVKATRTI